MSKEPPADATLEREWVKCSKPACKRCKAGRGHGPYWYAYWREAGRLRKAYVGKAVPRELEHCLSAERHAIAYRLFGRYYCTACMHAAGYDGQRRLARLAERRYEGITPTGDHRAELAGKRCGQCGEPI